MSSNQVGGVVARNSMFISIRHDKRQADSGKGVIALTTDAGDLGGAWSPCHFAGSVVWNHASIQKFSKSICANESTGSTRIHQQTANAVSSHHVVVVGIGSLHLGEVQALGGFLSRLLIFLITRWMFFKSHFLSREQLFLFRRVHGHQSCGCRGR